MINWKKDEKVGRNPNSPVHYISNFVAEIHFWPTFRQEPTPSQRLVTKSFDKGVDFGVPWRLPMGIPQSWDWLKANAPQIVMAPLQRFN